MKIVVVGLGGIGGYYGGRLASCYESEKKHSIYFIARGNHLKEIIQNGLLLKTPHDTITCRPALATDNPDDLGLLDLILFCTKEYDLEESASLCRNTLHSDTVIIPLLNGVDNTERLRAVLPGENILNGCVYISSHIEKPGVVYQTGGSCKLFFGSEINNPNMEIYKEIEKIFQDAGIDAVLSDNIATDVWSKFIFVSPFAGLTTMLQQPFGAILENADSRKMLEDMMHELISIAQALHIFLPDNLLATALHTAALFPYDTKSSMQLDFENKKHTELKTLIGYPVTCGKQIGIHTPLYESVYSALLKRL